MQKILSVLNMALLVVTVALLLLSARPAAALTPARSCVAANAAVGVSMVNLAIAVASRNPWAIATTTATAVGAIYAQQAIGCGGAPSTPPANCGSGLHSVNCN